MSIGGGGRINETPEERQQAEVLLEQWNYELTRRNPARRQYADRVTQAYAGNKAVATGRAAADADGSFGATAGGVATAAATRGAGLGSGKSNALVSDSLDQQAATTGLAKVGAGQNADDQHFDQVQQLVNVGESKRTAAQGGFDALADLAAGRERNRAGIAERESTAAGQLLGGLAGTAVTAGVSSFSRPKAPKNGLKDWGTDTGPYAGSSNW